MQSAIFSPFSWPAYVLPFWWSLGLIGALKLWVPAFGTFLLARRLGQSVGAALLAGVVAGFGLFHVVWLAWPLSSVWAWLPWVLLATDHVVRRPTARAFAALALVVALQYFGGHPETSFHVLAVALLFALLRGPRRVAWFLGGVAGGHGAGGDRAGPVRRVAGALVGPREPLGARAGADAAALRPRARAARLLGSPDAAGVAAVHRHARVLRGRAAADARGGRAAAADARAGRDRRRRRGVALAIVLGVQPFFFVANHVPGFAQAHNTRLAIVTLLCIALLAGWGLDTARRGRRAAGRDRARAGGRGAARGRARTRWARR